MWASAGCCLDYQHQGPRPDVPVETGTGDTGGLDEPCDGEDNDGDDLIDEGYPDADGDGRADCVDAVCEVESLPAEPVDESPACGQVLVPSKDPWNIEQLWDSGDRIAGGCQAGTVVADINDDGVSDVLCATWEQLVALSGDDGRVLWTSSEVDSYSPLAAADIDDDGGFEVVGIARDGHLIAIDGDGSVLWRGNSDVVSSIDGTSFDIFFMEIADLNADGDPELITSRAISSARDGSLLAMLDEPDWTNYRDLSLVVADLDQQGGLEIVEAGLAFHADGSLTWSQASPDDEYAALAHPVLLQADADPQAEIALLGYGGVMRVVDDDGTVISEQVLREGHRYHLACAGDLDADDNMELVVAIEDAVLALRSDGTVLWEQPIDDPNTYVGCTTFDLDLDGASEVILGDEHSFYILDGRTGEFRYSNPGRASITYADAPLVVDLDGDGSVEIVMTSRCGNCSEDTSITVYSNVNNDWPPGTGIWPSAAWSGTSLFLDGSIPRTPEAPWLETGVWRGQPPTVIPGADLRPEITDSCVSSCEPDVGTAALSLRLANLGPQEVQRGTTVALYGLDEQGQRQLLELIPFDDFLDNGWASDTVAVAIDVEQASRGIVLVAGDDGQGEINVDDCNQRNNELSWRLDACD